MNIPMTPRFLCLALLLCATRLHATAQNTFTDAEADATKTFLHDNFDGKKVAIVVGMLDEHGSRVLSAGTLDNGTTNAVNGDTLFFIGSVSKTFTALLLQDMVERGEMKLEDP